MPLKISSTLNGEKNRKIRRKHEKKSTGKAKEGKKKMEERKKEYENEIGDQNPGSKPLTTLISAFFSRSARY